MLDRHAVASAALIASISAPGFAQACLTEAVNVTPNGAISSDSTYAVNVWVSPDGRWVVWVDRAGDLVPGIPAGQFRPYIRDRHTGVTDHAARLSDGSIPNAGSLDYDMSPDLRWFAFASSASNVVPGDTPNSQDVFVLDRTTGLAERANIDSSGQPRAGADKPAISADGRFVVFMTGVAMEPADQNTGLDVYLRDRLLGTTRLASITPEGVQGIYWNDGPMVSDDGRYVAWTSISPNWIPGDGPSTEDIFRKDMTLGTFELLSRNMAGQIAGQHCFLSWMSGDGRYVGFSTFADGMVADEPQGCCGQHDAFLRDTETGQNTLVSRAEDGTIGNSDTYLTGVSDDRRYVALMTQSSNLLPPASGFGFQIVRKDLVTGALQMASMSSASQPGNGSSDEGAGISGDGNVVAFLSRATNLVPEGGGTDSPDLFARECPVHVGTPICFGDGTGTACPCGNSGAPGHGCASFTRPEGARVVALGDASVTNDTLILAGDSATNSVVTYFQGTGMANGGAGIVFGDGLVCVNGTVIRLGTRSTWNGTSRYPGPGDASVSVRGQVPAGGAVRHYQIWYRIAAPFCTPATFSFSNAVSIAWVP